MLRPLCVVLIVVGIALGVLGTFRAVTHHKSTVPRSLETAPVTFNRQLTPGGWSIYGQAGTGPYGTPIPVVSKVAAVGGGAVALSTPASPATLKTDGRTFAQSAKMQITTAGTYKIDLAPQSGSPLEVLVAPSPRSTFPWVAVGIDGAVLLAAGSALSLLDGRRRRQTAAFEAAYAAA